MHQTLWILRCLGLVFSTTPHWQMKGEWSAEFQVGGLPVDWQSVWTQMVPQLSKNSWQRTQWFQSQQTHTSNLICQKQKTQRWKQWTSGVKFCFWFSLHLYLTTNSGGVSYESHMLLSLIYSFLKVPSEFAKRKQCLYSGATSLRMGGPTRLASGTVARPLWEHNRQ